MPNIHICGFSGAASEDLKIRIDTIVQMLNLDAKAITTIHCEDMLAESCDGKRTSAPYLRIDGTDIDEITRIIDMIQQVYSDVDIEYSVISGFIPAAKK